MGDDDAGLGDLDGAEQVPATGDGGTGGGRDGDERASSGLGSRDLIASAADAYRWGSAHPDVALFHTRRYELMREALGVERDLLEGDPPEFWSRPEELRGLPELLRETIAQLTAKTSPFAGYETGSRAVSEAHRRHRRALAADSSSLQEALMDLADDLLLRLEPDLSNRSTTEQALIDAGLPDYVDPIDYW